MIINENGQDNKPVQVPKPEAKPESKVKKDAEHK